MNKSIKFLWDCLKKVFRRILLIKRLIISELDIWQSIDDVKLPKGMNVRLATESDIDNMNANEHGYDNAAKKYSKRRLNQGDKCLLACEGDRIVGFMWVMKNYMEISERKLIKLPGNKVYTYKGFVVKDYRGKRVTHLLHLHRIMMLREEKREVMLSTVEWGNSSSIKARKRMGFRDIGMIYQIRILFFWYDLLPKKYKLLVLGE